MKQYFSRFYNKWVDFKEGVDCEESLKKYGYKIRNIKDKKLKRRKNYSKK